MVLLKIYYLKNELGTMHFSFYFLPVFQSSDNFFTKCLSKKSLNPQYKPLKMPRARPAKKHKQLEPSNKPEVKYF